MGVDTIRFYQGRGLLEPPLRRGRVAFYGDGHAERLRRIRRLKERGFSLAQIRRVVADETEGATPDPLLAALARVQEGSRTLSRAELAAEAGVPAALLDAALQAGLIEPLEVSGAERFTEADLEMLSAGRSLLEAGFPLETLLVQAGAHARNVRQLCDAAIDLFDDHVRKGGDAAGDPRLTAEAFQQLLPVATRLVALHFQRTLVARALERLEGKDERAELDAALDTARLEVEVAWR